WATPSLLPHTRQRKKCPTRRPVITRSSLRTDIRHPSRAIPSPQLRWTDARNSVAGCSHAPATPSTSTQEQRGCPPDAGPQPVRAGRVLSAADSCTALAALSELGSAVTDRSGGPRQLRRCVQRP